MYDLLKIWALILHLTLFCPLTWGQGNEYVVNVDHYQVADGLSHREIFDIHQDEKGFIWLATKYGLNRFDGQKFKWWTKEKNQLSNNSIHFIHEDADGILWLFTNENWYHSHMPQDLSWVDSKSGQVISIEERFGVSIPFSIDEVVSFVANDEGQLFFNLKNGSLYTYHGGGKFSRSKNQFTSFYLEACSEGGKVWGYTGQDIDQLEELIELDGEGNVLNRYAMTPSEKWLNIMPSDDPDNLWFSSYIHDALEIYTIDAEGERQVYHNELMRESLDAVYPFWDKKIYRQNNTGHFWFKGDDHLQVIHPDEGLIYDFGKNEEKLLQARIHTIFFDREGLVWMGSENGLFRVELRTNQFSRHLYLPYDSYQSTDGYSCRGIWANDQEVWVNSYKGRRIISLEDKSVESLPKIPYRKNNGILSHTGYYPLSIKKDDDGGVWCGEYILMHRDSEGIESYFKWEREVKSEPSTWSLFSDDSGKIWLGTDRGIGFLDAEKGLLAFDKKLNDVHDLRKGTIHAFVESKSGHIWMCTTVGLFAWEPEKGIIGYWSPEADGKYFIPHENVFHLFEEEEGKLWLATGGGLIRLSIDGGEDVEGHFEHFTIADGLSNNTLYAVYEDERENLWMSSDYGIIRFDKTNREAKAYLPRDGVTHHEFNRISHFQASDGTLYFGSLNGVTSFHPSDFYSEKEEFNAPLCITDFQQFDGQKNELVNRTVELLKSQKIILGPSDRFFRLEFSLLDYRDTDKIRYAWKIEGHDEGWNHFSENFLRVSGLPPGDYVLKIKGQSSNGQWSDKEIKVPIVVQRAFYAKPGYWAVCVIVILGAVFYYYKWRTMAFKKRQEELEEAVQQRTETIIQQADELAQLDHFKSRFFANVSHELRTPLSLMLGPIGSALKDNKLDPKTFSYLKLAQVNGKKLLELVNEILDLSKMESGRLALEEQPVQVLPFLRRLLSQFESNANIRGVDLTFSYQAEKDLWVKLDEPKFEIIWNNLLSNALKFTPRGGKIEVEFSSKEQSLQLSVADNGQGIHPGDLPHVFDRFFQSKQANMPARGGTGIGLSLCREYANLFGGKVSVDSQLGEGSRFTFDFPKKEIIGGVQHEVELNEEISLAPNFGEASSDASISASMAKLKKLLIVEDNVDLRHYLKMVLGERYQVKAVENGKLALDYLYAQNDCSLIISDVMMPVMDGFQFLEKLKSEDRWRHLPVIMLTARAELRDKLKALRTGVDDYMLKPFNEEELLTRVDNLLFHTENRSLGKEEGMSSNEPRLAAADAEWLEEQEQLLMDRLSNTKFTAAMWAAEAAVSERHLQRKIKNLTGLSPYQYLTEARLLKARTFLEDGRYKTVSEVAYAVGFSNAQSFTRNFRKRFGRVPSGYF